MTAALVAFLRARLADATEKATAMADATWPAEVWVVPNTYADDEPTGCVAVGPQYTKAFRRVWNPAQARDGVDNTDTGWAVHESAVQVWGREVAAAALAEVDAKRAILDAYLPPGTDPHPGLPCTDDPENDPGGVSYRDQNGFARNACVHHLEASKRLLHSDYVLRLLAAPYRGHPEFQPEWAPDLR